MYKREPALWSVEANHIEWVEELCFGIRHVDDDACAAAKAPTTRRAKGCASRPLAVKSQLSHHLEPRLMRLDVSPPMAFTPLRSSLQGYLPGVANNQ